jgi:hypothetical protein
MPLCCDIRVVAADHLSIAPEYRTATSLSDIWKVVDGRNKSGHDDLLRPHPPLYALDHLIPMAYRLIVGASALGNARATVG